MASGGNERNVAREVDVCGRVEGATKPLDCEVELVGSGMHGRAAIQHVLQKVAQTIGWSGFVAGADTHEERHRRRLQVG